MFFQHHGKLNRRSTVVRLAVGIGTFLDKPPDHVKVALLNRIVKRHVAMFAPIVDIDAYRQEPTSPRLE